MCNDGKENHAMRISKPEATILRKAFKPYAEKKMTPFEKKVGKAKPEIVNALLERLTNTGLLGITKLERAEAMRAVGENIHRLRGTAMRRADPKTGKMSNWDATTLAELQELYERLNRAKPRS